MTKADSLNCDRIVRSFLALVKVVCLKEIRECDVKKGNKHFFRACINRDSFDADITILS